MKKVLFPTDFSKNSDHALRYALRLCESQKAELIIFHSCHLNALAFQLLTEETNEEKIIEQAEKELKAYWKKHKTETDKIKIKQVVDYGLAADAIAKAAKKYDSDLIIMGTKGAKGLEEVLLGSITMAVIEKSDCPVMAIPEKSKYKNIQRISFATDFRENDAESISKVAEIASRFNAEIIIIHVADSLVSSDYEEALLEVFEEEVRKKVNYKHLSFQILKGSDASKTLNNFIEEGNIDLIALATRKKNIFTRLFDSSFTKKVAYHTQIPLLAFHISKK